MARYKDYDWVLIATIFTLSLFGLVMVYSSSYVLAVNEMDDFRYYFHRQLMWLIIGTSVFFLFMHFPYRFFRKMTPLIILLSLLTLTLVLIPGIGIERNFATRWLGIGPFQFQPSEFVKLGLVIYLAQVYSQKQQYINRFVQGVLPPLIIVVIIFTLIILQPDLGTAAAILLVTVVIVFLSGARLLHLGMLGMLSGLVALYLAIQEEYRMLRLISFQDPFQYAEDSGYQLIQSYIAIAHGGPFGTGLGQSVQKLLYLPEAHTDFILAIISEELGIFGVAFTFFLFALLCWRGVMIGARCKDPFGSLLAFGIVFQFTAQAIFNAGAVSGLLPITGITLPFISYGGSSLLVSLAAAGILVNVSKYASKKRNSQKNEPDVDSA